MPLQPLPQYGGRTTNEETGGENKTSDARGPGAKAGQYKTTQKATYKSGRKMWAGVARCTQGPRRRNEMNSERNWKKGTETEHPSRQRKSLARALGFADGAAGAV